MKKIPHTRTASIGVAAIAWKTFADGFMVDNFANSVWTAVTRVTTDTI